MRKTAAWLVRQALEQIGVGEAFLDGIPMLVISGGVRNDMQQGFQLRDVDQQALMRPLTKATYKIESYDEVMPTVYRSYGYRG